jgi:uncharacterized membrane protein YedE/YeeE
MAFTLYFKSWQMKNLKYLLLGSLFGIILCKVQAVSWWRMQEMFRFDGFYMYGLFVTAIPTGILSVWLIKKFNIKTVSGEPIIIPRKKFNWGYVIGGLLFGIGWAFSGACPGPLLALIGAGKFVVIVVFISALLGTLVYSWLRPRLPH